MTIPVLVGKLFGKIKAIEYKKLLSIASRFRFSIMVVPEETSYIRSRTFPYLYVMSFLGAFSVLVAIITGILMVYTPLNSLFFSQTIQLSHHQVNDLRQLEKKISFLVKEIDNLKDSNERLQRAIILGDSTLLQEFTRKPVSQKPQAAPRTGGSLLTVIRELIEQYSSSGKERQLDFSKPCDGFVTNAFKPDEGHYGTDYSLTVGSPVFAACNGYIIFSDYVAEEGYMVILAHYGGYISVYKHCSQLFKRTRERVMQGELIALSGNSGRLTTGPHLHFEIWHDGVCIDPQSLLIEN